MNSKRRSVESTHSFPERYRKSSGYIGFRSKFFLGIAAILLFFNSICALLIYRQGTALLEESAYAKSQIAVALVEATQGYVREVLRPKMYELLGEDVFVLEAMSSSYASRVVMDNFKKSLPAYLYRRVAIDARNPQSEANPEEAKMIRYFEEHPDRSDWEGIIEVGNETFFMCYRPVRFNASCLHCHGDPKEAPAGLTGRYGAERGFGRKDGQIAGVSAMGIPAKVALARIEKTSMAVFIGGLSFTAVLFLVIGLFFNRVVISDLRSLLGLFRAGLKSDEENRFFKESDTKDEVGALKSAAMAMAQYLAESRRKLEENAEHLERAVTERTGELLKSEQRLRDQVEARNLELKTLNTIAELTTRANCLSDAFPKVLEETLKLISAKGAGLYLIQQDAFALELICHKNAPGLIDRVDLEQSVCEAPSPFPADILEGQVDSLCESACGHISFFVDAEMRKGMNIPLCCRGRVLGVIAFTDVDFQEITREFNELISSVGRQIGIAIESLQTTRKLLHSKELLQSVFDGITDMVILMDSELRIKMVNKAYLKRYGLVEQDVLGRHCYELHSEDTCRYPDCGMKRSYMSRSPVVEEVPCRNGEIFLMHFYPIANDQDEVESVVRYARDITDQKRIEQQIQKTERLSSLGQLSAGVAHEINNPLGVILTYTSLLKRQLENLPLPLSDVAKIEKHALNCKRIVSDLLKFARSESTARQFGSLNTTIEEAVKMVSHQFSRKDIEIQLDLSDDLPLVSMDSGKMKQVFVNLLINSEQAIKHKGVIRIGTSHLKESRQAEIVFEDNGEGICAEVLPKVFDPFFTTKAVGEGTGLGLSVSYGIIKDHRGEIHVNSEPGEWTQFLILLPISEEV
jgi:PAS domain S-box-containing protein